ncbi:MAG: hypothetical protein IJW30_02720 [Clostridia bacterium]|nr:hypothetical protein [Clostridia bacterium]
MKLRLTIGLLLIALLMLPLAGCIKTKDGGNQSNQQTHPNDDTNTTQTPTPSDGDTETTQTPTPSGGDTETTTHIHGIDCDCGGWNPNDLKNYTYRALVAYQSYGSSAFYCEDFWVDPVTGGGDALSFAVIQRNERIEQQYNCQIEQVWASMSSMYEEMGQAFLNDKNYELAILPAPDAAACAAMGYLSNLKNDSGACSYLYLQGEYFDQNAIKDLAFGDALYYISGDMNISTMDNTLATVFNTDMYWDIADAMVETFEDDDFASPYTMVAEGKWTVQNMMKIAYENTYDANREDGTLSYDKGDTIGYYQYNSSALYYYYGAGMRITENAGGFPRFTINSDEAGEVYDTLYDLMNLNLNTWQPNGASGDRAKNFTSGSVLFADYLLWDIRRTLYHADTDFAYGLLPVPTLAPGEATHNAVHLTTMTYLWTLPYKRANEQLAANMMNIMAEESAKEGSTWDTYTRLLVPTGSDANNPAYASIERIRTSLVYDVALLYSPQGEGLWGEFDKLLLTIDTATDKEYATYTSSERMQTAEEEMQETVDMLNKYGAD